MPKRKGKYSKPKGKKRSRKSKTEWDDRYISFKEDKKVSEENLSEGEDVEEKVEEIVQFEDEEDCMLEEERESFGKRFFKKMRKRGRYARDDEEEEKEEKDVYLSDESENEWDINEDENEEEEKEEEEEGVEMKVKTSNYITHLSGGNVSGAFHPLVGQLVGEEEEEEWMEGVRRYGDVMLVGRDEKNDNHLLTMLMGNQLQLNLIHCCFILQSLARPPYVPSSGKERGDHEEQLFLEPERGRKRGGEGSGLCEREGALVR